MCAEAEIAKNKNNQADSESSSSYEQGKDPAA